MGKLQQLLLSALMEIVYTHYHKAILLCCVGCVIGIFHHSGIAAIRLKMLHCFAEDIRGVFPASDFGAGKDLREEVPHLAALQCCFHLIAIRCGGNAHLDIPAVQFFQEIDHTRLWLG